MTLLQKWDFLTSFYIPMDRLPSPLGRQGGECSLTAPTLSETSLWGPVIADPAESNWIGASRPTNNTGEISAIYHALKWLSRDSEKHSPGTPQRVNLLSLAVCTACVFLGTTR